MERFKTTRHSGEFLERLTRATGIRRNFWSRAALGWSLSLESLPDEDQDLDSEGMEHTRQMIFGDDEATLLALIRQRYQRHIPVDGLARLVKVHVERGLDLIQKEYERLNRRGDELMLFLLQQCAGKQPSATPAGPQREPTVLAGEHFTLSMEVGKIVGSAQPVVHTLNGPGAAPHVAVMGRNSTGKTRTALAFLAQIRGAVRQPFPFLVFDYAKGDVGANADFVRATGARVVALPGQTIGLAPLAIEQRDEHSVGLAAHRFRDTICSVVRGLGPKQKIRCLHIIRETYDQLEGNTPDLGDVVDVARRRYADNNWPDDSLLACLSEFTNFPLFRPPVEVEHHEFFDAPHVIDVHRLPEDLRKLAVFLMLDRLYADIMALPDAPLDASGNRQMRLIIVIDEAHHYLPCKQPTLEKMVREVRSKGVAIWLLSQSPDDFDQPRYNFAREMGLAVVFSCVLEKPRMLEAVLGGKVNPKRLSQLPAGVALTRVPGSDAPVEIQAWQP